jgi:hypothetical protein
MSTPPIRSQAGHAPCGALNENRRGSISEMVKPLIGQANFSDRLVVREDIATRLADSFETALKLADGLAYVDPAGGTPPAAR